MSQLALPVEQLPVKWAAKWSQFNYPLQWSGHLFWRIYCPPTQLKALAHDLRTLQCYHVCVRYQPPGQRSGHYVFFRCSSDKLALLAAVFPLVDSASFARFSRIIQG